jgi:MYXO-CTERM domain-containing protein
MVFVNRRHMVRWASLASLVLAAGSCNESRSGETASDTGTKREQAALGSEVAVSPRVWTHKANIQGSQGVARDMFGQVLAAQGNTLVVGGEGFGIIPSSVYVFTGSGANWTEQEKLVPPEAIDTFGWSLAISGDTIVVGAPDFASRTMPGVGAAYVYVRSGSDWTFQQKLTGTSSSVHVEFGRAVAIDGDTAVVSAPREHAHDASYGVAYVFVRSGTTWTFQQKLSSYFVAEQRFFGTSVAIAGNEIMVGQPNEVWPGNHAGAYMFNRSGSTWSYYFYLNSLNINYEAGRHVAMDSETAVLGYGSRGVAQYTKADDRWWEQDQHNFARPIGPLALSGDILALAAPATDAPYVLGGAVYVQVRNGTSWELTPPLVPTAYAGAYGMSVAVTGGTVFAGGISGSEPGRVHIFTEGAGGSGGAGGAGGAAAGAGGAGAGGVGAGGLAGAGGTSGSGGSGLAGAGAGAGQGGNGVAGSGGSAGDGGGSGESGEGGESGGGESGNGGEPSGGSAGTGGAAARAGSGGAATGGVRTGGSGGTAGASAGRSSSGGSTLNGENPPSDEDGGCGCSVPGARPPALGAIWLLALASIALRRRSLAPSR